MKKIEIIFDLSLIFLSHLYRLYRDLPKNANFFPGSMYQRVVSHVR